ncbi:MAG: adenylyltransferase/cytidyltransferase family protein [Nanoarchaeota archaeon]
MSAYGIRTIEEIEGLAKELRLQNKTIITTNGSYDLIHSAHIRFLKKAKDLGDVLIVLLNSDESVRINKGLDRPIIPENERAYLLSELKPVDYVVIFPQDRPLEYLERIKPNIHVKGGTWIEERINEEKELIEKCGGKYKTFELEKGYSTSDIIKRIRKV